MTHRLRPSRHWVLSRVVLVTIPLLLATAAAAQTTRNRPGGAPEEPPVFQDYRGVQLGWLADDVRKKLGDPANKSDEQDIYLFGEKETCQIYYDKATKKVTAISVDFMNGASGVITPQQVFGADFTSNADGSKQKLVRYPKAGYWVSYNRTAGDTPMITITMQKMAP